MSYTVQIGDVIGFCEEADDHMRFVIENVDTDYRITEYVPKGDESSLLRVAAALLKHIDEVANGKHNPL